MYVGRVAAFAAALLAQSLVANADEADADTAARIYFARACADKIERAAVYAPDTNSLSDITTGATSRSVSWRRIKFERLCALPELYVYHCHTTDDVLTKFPSGSTGAVPGDFGNAAEMEFTCAEVTALEDRPVAFLNHGLVTPRGEVIKYGFTQPTLDKIHEEGLEFGRILKLARPRRELEAVEAEAQHSFSDFNARHYQSFIQFAITACPNGDIEHCKDFTVEHLANTLSRDDWRFIRVAASPVSERDRDPVAQQERIQQILDDLKKRAPAEVLDQMLATGGNVIAAAQALGDIAELAPDTLEAFVSEGRVLVSICDKDAEGLLPCEQAKARIGRLAASCPGVKTAILDRKSTHKRDTFNRSQRTDRSSSSRPTRNPV